MDAKNMAVKVLSARGVRELVDEILRLRAENEALKSTNGLLVARSAERKSEIEALDRLTQQEIKALNGEKADITRQRDEALIDISRKQNYINGCRQIIGTQGNLEGEIGALMDAKYRSIARIESLEEEVQNARKDTARLEATEQDLGMSLGVRQKSLWDAEYRVHALEGQNAAMRGAIEGAAHAEDCGSRRELCSDCRCDILSHYMGSALCAGFKSEPSALCNCWKSRALALLQPAPAEADNPEATR